MVTNFAKRRVKLRIERAKFQFVLIVFCNRAVLLFNFLIKKPMDSNESYHSESQFYYPNEEDKENNPVRLYFRFIIWNLEINKNVIHRHWSVRIGKNCALCLEYSPRPAASGRTWDRGHSFSQYGPTKAGE